MQVPSVASQLQQQLITGNKPGSGKPTTPAPNSTKVDSDGDSDASATGKGGSLDTKG
jgi:hypothetical protein